MSLIDSVLAQATAEADRDTAELKLRASASVDALQAHVMRDGGSKMLRAGKALMGTLSEFGGEHALTPGELALILAASMHNVLQALPGMTPELARAIALELVSGPRSE